MNMINYKMIILNLKMNFIRNKNNILKIRLIIINVKINKEYNIIQIIYNHNNNLMNNIRIR